MNKISYGQYKTCIGCTVCTGNASSNDDTFSVNLLTAATHANDFLCVSYDTVHQMSCAGGQTSAVKVERH